MRRMLVFAANLHQGWRILVLCQNWWYGPLGLMIWHFLAPFHTKTGENTLGGAPCTLLHRSNHRSVPELSCSYVCTGTRTSSSIHQHTKLVEHVLGFLVHTFTSSFFLNTTTVHPTDSVQGVQLVAFYCFEQRPGQVPTPRLNTVSGWVGDIFPTQDPETVRRRGGRCRNLGLVQNLLSKLHLRRSGQGALHKAKTPTLQRK